LDLGIATNNYAEYTGVLVAQILFSLFKQKQAQIYTDSELVVKQV
jgi:ribonuclease HI